jgi:hypothetical protein
MLKKLFVTAAAAATVSVPLAGVAWAAPSSDAGSSGNGVGTGGIPTKNGNLLANGVSPSANPGGGPVTPGSQFSQVAKVPDLSTPVAQGIILTAFSATHTSTVPGFVLQTTPYGPTPSGLVTKAYTPGCSNGRSGVTQPGASTCVP